MNVSPIINNSEMALTAKGPTKPGFRNGGPHGSSGGGSVVLGDVRGLFGHGAVMIPRLVG